MAAHRFDMRACSFAKSRRADRLSASLRAAYSPVFCLFADSRNNSSSNFHTLLVTGSCGNIGEHRNQSGDALMGAEVLSTTKSVVLIVPRNDGSSRWRFRVYLGIFSAWCAHLLTELCGCAESRWNSPVV
jgi:hypothetical protein